MNIDTMKLNTCFRCEKPMKNHKNSLCFDCENSLNGGQKQAPITEKQKRHTRGRVPKVGTGEAKGGMVTIRIPHSLHAWLAATAIARDVSINQLVLDLILAEQEKHV